MTLNRIQKLMPLYIVAGLIGLEVFGLGKTIWEML